jgi:hypothetical protein
MVCPMAVLRSVRSFLPGAFLAAALLPLLSCSPSAHRALYYWKTARGPSPSEIQIADRMGVDTLYVRLFDIESDGTACPALASSTDFGRRRIVPVVYIVNEALTNAGFRPKAAAASLFDSVQRWPGWSELQVDCDWTPGTRASYFSLLETLLEKLHAQGRRLSATIRLHQVKYRADTGVPPVDRGMLMAYNLLPPTDASTRSSILDTDEMAGYLSSVKSYPLPLDAALPMFSWVAQWEGPRLIGLIDDARAPAELAGPGFASIGQGRFEALARGSLRGRSVEKGDVLVVDRPGPLAVQQAARMLHAALRGETRSVALYHLDSETIQSFSGGEDAQIEAVYGALGARRDRRVSAPRVRPRTVGGRRRVRRKRSARLLLVVRG